MICSYENAVANIDKTGLICFINTVGGRDCQIPVTFIVVGKR